MTEVEYGPEGEELFRLSPISSFPTLESAGVNRTEKARLEMAEMGRTSLYYLCKVILGMKDLNVRVHMPMCDYYDSTRGVYIRRLSLMPRTHLKTSLWTVGESILDVVVDPNVRILIVMDTGRNAQLVMIQIQQHFEHNQLFRWVYGGLIPDNFNNARWNTNEMVVNRTISGVGEPTIDAIGALGGSESRHYDKIRADDLITEKCIRSEVEMDKVISWANGLESMLIKQREGQLDFVGSRKKKGDLYESLLRAYGENYVPVSLGPFVELHGEMVTFCRSARENGKLIFPEFISEKFLTRLYRTDPERAHAQYGNSPKGVGVNTFAVEWLRQYRRVDSGRLISCVHNKEELLLVSPWSMDRIILFDPSVAEKQKSSQQAILVVAKGSHPFRIVLETRIGHFPPDEAIDTLFELQEKWKCSIVSIEKRGFQGWVKYWLAERAEATGVAYLPVVEWPPIGSPVAQWAKTEHIRALQPMVRANYLWIAEEMTDLWELLEFYPNVRWDDGLDALAQGNTYWPMAEDAEEAEVRKKAEIDYLDAALLGDPALVDAVGGLHTYDSAWDEAKFLAQFDATGYNFRDA